MEEYKYTFQLLICVVLGFMGSGLTNALSKTPEVLVNETVPVNTCRVGPCIVCVGTGIK